MCRLKNLRIGVTSGPTRAWIDPVRYIANASTGGLGALIAERFVERGSRVEAIVGPGGREPRAKGIRLHPIETPADLEETLKRLASEKPTIPFRVWVHAMAVLDFIPRRSVQTKLSSESGPLHLELIPTPKIIQSFKKLFPEALLVGFKLESTLDTAELKGEARALALRADCDLVVANPVPFRQPENHTAYFWDTIRSEWSGPFVGKSRIAREIVHWTERTVDNDVLP